MGQSLEKDGPMNTYEKDFVAILEDKSLFDLQINLPNDEVVLAHKFLLIARCPKFRKLFCEVNQSNSKNKGVNYSSIRSDLDLEAVDLQKVIGATGLDPKSVSKAFHELHYYFYHDRVNWDNVFNENQTLISFGMLIERLEVVNLIEPTNLNLIFYVSRSPIDRFIDLLNQILKFKNYEKSCKEDFFTILQELVVSGIANNLEEPGVEILSLPALKLVLQFSSESLNTEQKTQVLGVSDHNIEKETQKFCLIIRWVEANSPIEIEKHDLLGLVSLSNVRPQVLIQNISPARYQTILEETFVNLARSPLTLTLEKENQHLRDQIKALKRGTADKSKK
ncbi:hypothetical protein G9A89_005003 [Geosiphon pyriformis]|nr:hypothetical protein G9A89_005003 [Geosiphon pyriformis]